MKGYLFNILAVFLLTISFSCFSQEMDQADAIEIRGTIVDAETKEPVPYVHVVNKTLGKGTVSNSDGRFLIKMGKTDTLLFSAIGFKSYAFTLKDKLPSDQLRVNIELNTATMELQTVNIFAYKDEYALKRAIIEMDMPLETNEPFNSGWTRSKNTKPGVSIGGPISAIYNTFSKEGKERRKLEKYQKEYDHQKTIRVKYNERIVKGLTGLPEDKIVEFMNFCKLQDSFVERSTAYDIALAVNRCMSEFLKE